MTAVRTTRAPERASRARRIARLIRYDHRLLTLAIVQLWNARLSLWLFPFAAVHRRFVGRTLDSRTISKHDTTKSDTPSIAHIVGMIDRASRITPKATCLPRALAAYRLLQQNGYHPTLRIGVRDSARPNGDTSAGIGTLAAHAWLECDGRAVIGAHAGEFTTLPILPISSRSTERQT